MPCSDACRLALLLLLCLLVPRILLESGVKARPAASALVVTPAASRATRLCRRSDIPGISSGRRFHELRLHQAVSVVAQHIADKSFSEGGGSAREEFLPQREPPMPPASSPDMAGSIRCSLVLLPFLITALGQTCVDRKGRGYQGVRSSSCARTRRLYLSSSNGG